MFVDALTDHCQLNIVDPQLYPNLECDPIYEPSVQSAVGLGGGTAFWHNGLIEPSPCRLESWFPQQLYADQSSAAFKKLSNYESAELSQYFEKITNNYKEMGFCEKSFHSSPLFYPKKRRVLSQYKKKQFDDIIIKDRIEKFSIKNGKVVSAVGASGIDYYSDYFILSAGGISSPIILNNTFSSDENSFLLNDHPTGAIANIQLKASISDLWNYKINDGGGFIRCPFVYIVHGMEIAFYLRPNIYSKNIYDVYNSTNYAGKIRNNPFNIDSYLNLIRNPGDVYDAMSIQFGLNIKSHNYTIFCVAEMSKSLVEYYPAGNKIHLSGVQTKKNTDINCYEAALQNFLQDIHGITQESYLYPNRWQELGSSAHLYGSSRAFMDPSPTRFLDVDNLANLKVVDASAIGDVGFVNTGITIAVAARVAAQQLNQEILE